ncbi:MAG: N-acetyltransferase [Planctomycetota bacterium]|nr:MAG: N-acetyltransferase [Planctomycetota bacterium]
MSKKEFFAHESSYIDTPSQIGNGTTIWHFCHIMKDVIIGEECNFGQNVFIGEQVSIGNNVKVQNNVSIYTGTIIEDNVFLGPSCVLTNVSNPRSEVNRKTLYEETLIKKGASIGANATIVCGKTIGRFAFVAAGCVVTNDIPDYGLYMGVPGKQFGWISRHGHPMKKKDEEGFFVCPESKFKYMEENGHLKCIDLDEDSELPELLRGSTKRYRDFK